MALVLDEAQTLLRESASELVQSRSPVGELRRLRDSDDAHGFDRTLWTEMAKLGWAGILVPETYGGTAFGLTGLAVVLQECGRTLTASPLLPTALIGASCLARAGSAGQKRDLLAPLAAGEHLTALALEEAAHHAPYRIETTASVAPGGAGFVLNGEKIFVLDGHVADTLIVVARTAGYAEAREGLTLFLVPRDAPGLTVTRTYMVDSRNAARVTLDAVPAGADQVLGAVGRGADTLDPVLDLARVGLAAEMLGGTLEAFERTVEYLKMREQFGVPIGSFQALKHRAAAMFSEIELAKSAVMGALEADEREARDLAPLASLAKARLSDTYQLVAAEAIQMHGGIGMTDEEEIGFFFKRARVAAQTFGDARFHRDRYARLCGF